MSTGMRVAMVLLAVVELLGALLAAFFAALSVMMFDAPGSAERGDVWLLFWSTAAVPIAFLIGTVFAVLAAIRYTRRRALIALGAPAAAVGWVILLFAALG